VKSEFALIEWIRRQGRQQERDVALGIGDDMAILETGKEKVLITTDILLEGVHFELVSGAGKTDLPPATLSQVGYKAMACGLSDCAAMAALPWVAVVSVALPEKMGMDQAKELYAGLQQAAEQYQCPVVGGDTTSWEQGLAIDVTMLARAAGVEPVLRSGAKAGDVIMVTGQLGGSRTGGHLEFAPRVREGRLLAELADLHAMIDVSDGLSIDLDHICQRCGQTDG